MRPCVFLDRDDTLNECRGLPAPERPHPCWKPGDLTDPARVRLLPGVREALADLKRAGMALVVVSNQGSVARGSATCQDVDATNARLLELLGPAPAGGAMLDAIYYCPYHPQGRVPMFTREHPWRKPGPGMLLAAAVDLGLDLARSWLVGDMPRDAQAGVAAGLAPERCLLVGPDPAATLPDLPAAARHILRRGDRAG